MAESDIPGFDAIRAASTGEGPVPTTCRDAGTFVHLHNHTEYSLLDGCTRLGPMCEKARDLGMPAIAITDHGYMYGCAEFYKAAVNAGIKPIIGCEVYFTPDSSLSREHKPELYHMILLAKDNRGYRNLMHLVSESATDNFYYKPRTTLEMLERYHEGLICTSACIAGIIPKSIDRGEYDIAREWAQNFIDIFGTEDFYIEIQNHGPEVTTDSGLSEPQINDVLVRLAHEMGLKVVGTNDFHYLDQADAYTQDLMMCIGMGKVVSDTERMKFKNDQFYLKSPEEMAEALKDHPECLATTLEIADKCNVTIEFGNIILPRYPFLEEGQTNESLLREMATKGLEERYGDLAQRPDVTERFEHEMEIICDKGFAAYFLIVAEFASWARGEGIGVGPGRGSAAGSIVSYAMGITSFDPLANDLIFERFLSPERTEMPDIDMDFDDERRLDVIQHCRDIYGDEKIAHVITYGKMKAKQAVVDAARVLGYPVYVSTRISKMIPFDPKMTLERALATNPDLKKAYDTDADTAKIVDAAKKLEGLTRNEGVHASAVIICRDAVADYVPVKKDTKGDVIITQYDGVMTADMGLLKMDFLGLRTLTVISKALANIKANHGIDIDIDKVDWRGDEKMFDLMRAGATGGVFQIESSGMRSLLKRMQPDTYDDIVAVIALFRPGPLGAGMVDDFVDRKQGKKEVAYYDERLKPVLESTYGTIVYQEQVMRISVVMSGFTTGESDKVRKAVAKKKVALMKETVQTWADGTSETMEEHWMNGAVRNGYDRAVAQKIWDDVLAFAEYAFNKSHSAAYGILTMQTAWLKAHYPNEYMAAVLTSYTGKTEKIVHYINICKQDGIPVLPPDINASGRDFTATDEGVRFGLAGIKGVGEGVVDIITRERGENGPFTDLYDFVYRMPAEVCNRRVTDALVKAGAFDSTGWTRRQLMGFLSDEGALLERALKRRLDREAGQVTMFDLFADDSDGDGDGSGDGDGGSGLGSGEDKIPPADGVEWPRLQKLAYEKEVVGIYVSDHPLSPYTSLLAANSHAPLSSADDDAVFHDGRTYDIAGMVADVAVKQTKAGRNMAIVTLEDLETTVDVVLFPDAWEKYRGVIEGTDGSGDAGGMGGAGEWDGQSWGGGPGDAAGAAGAGSAGGAVGAVGSGDAGGEGEIGASPVVHIRGKFERSDRGVQVIAYEVEALSLTAGDGRDGTERAPRRAPRAMKIHLGSEGLLPDTMSQLSSVLSRYPGTQSVSLVITQPDGRTFNAQLPLRVNCASEELVRNVDALVGAGAVEVS